jgi:hypothetical protein
MSEKNTNSVSGASNIEPTKSATEGKSRYETGVVGQYMIYSTI